jgi:GxxExxY protein
MSVMTKPESAEGAEERTVPRLSRPPEDEVTDKIIGAAIEVHRHLGPGLLESAYEECLCYELSQQRLRFRRQVHLPIAYKGIKLDCGYKMDIVVEDMVVVEIKTVEQVLPVHAAQLLTYLKLSGKRVGLMLNFNEPVLKRGLKRFVNRFATGGEDCRSSAPSASEPREPQRSRPPSQGVSKTRRLGASAVK